MDHIFSSLTTSRAAAAFLSTAAISVAPNLLLLLFPNIEDQQAGFRWLSLGQAMAAGGLLGDVFLHTMEEADATSGIWILGGYTVFFAVDLLVRTLQSGTDENYQAQKAQNNVSEKPPGLEVIRSTIILNVAADALHNFTDGLAIGSTYAGSKGLTVGAVLSSHTRGWITTISIMCHEIPHEIGDYCTLLRSGFTRTQAILMQLCTAVAAFAGTATAMYTQTWLEKELLWITAGGFIYLAASTLLPEVLQEISIESRALSFRFAQLFAFIVGIGFLYAVALLEDYDFQGSNTSIHAHQHGHRNTEL